MEEFLGRSLQKLREASILAAQRVEKLESFSHIATRESLVELISKKLKGRNLLLASNREPYVHFYQGDEVAWLRTAGGLTTALDSVASAVNATWVCHGDGEADFRVTDESSIVGVPPGNPHYRLKRLRLSRAEVRGYYEGFANEVLWPLCHVCYVRPKFNVDHWQIYQEVNRKFAKAILEIATPSSIVFLQDYHLSLVAKYLKEERSDLTTLLFWHIPWPNPEIFQICPWKKEILEGLLANDILGFHLYYHASNFMETVGLELESRLDWEQMQISRQANYTRIRAYPISVDFTSIFQQAARPDTAKACQEIITTHRLHGKKIGLGVDRLDYTKGVLERLDAFEHLFEKYPDYQGKVSFIQIGVPSRTKLEDYQAVVTRIENRCLAINAKYARPEWDPIIFLKGQQSFDALIPFYKLADFCAVSSLHDGMNLVAKEFVAASSNDRGVLILSRFTGAARELTQALQVNPYDREAFTDAIHQALSMPAEEQKNRLERMRLTVAENNIFTWAQAIFNDVIRLVGDNPTANGTGTPA